MSIIKDYFEYFRGTSPAIEFAQTIKEAIIYLLEKDRERYALGRTIVTPPLDYSDMPGYEFGFRPMEICLTELKKSSSKGKTGSSSCEEVLRYSEWISGRTVNLSPASVYELPEPMDAECYALYRSGLRYIGKPSGNIPLLYNKVFGEIYYYPMYLEIGKAGRLRLRTDDRGIGMITAINWITGQVTAIGHQMLAPFTRWCIPELIHMEDGKGISRFLERTGFNVREELMAKTAEEVAELPRPITSGPTSDDLSDFVTAPGEHLNAGPLAVYGFLELVYDLPHVALNSITTELSKKTQMAMDQYLKLLQMMGNLFQSALQTWDKSSWFLLTLLKSIKSAGKRIDPSITSLPQWLGINRPTWKKFMAKPTAEPFMFFMLMNQYAPTSYEAFEKTYANVLALAPRTCAITAGVRPSCARRAITYTAVKNRQGKVLFSSHHMPLGMGFYTNFNLKKYISIHQYFKWLRQEMNLAVLQKKATPEDAIDVIESNLQDYNRMAHEVLPSVGYTFPHNLLKAHDVMVENYNRIKKEKLGTSASDDEFMAFARCYAKKRCDVYMDAQFVVRAPASSLDLYEEGITLNHCVGAYGNDILAARGSMLIFFLRSAKHPDEPLVTIQVDKGPEDKEYHFSEIAGKGNRLPTEAETDFCDKWLLAFNSSYKAAVAADKVDALDFDGEVMTWISTLGLSLEAMPHYQVSESKERNYEQLFTAALEILAARVTEGDDSIDVVRIHQELAKFCGKLRFSKLFYNSIISIIDTEVA